MPAHLFAGLRVREFPCALQWYERLLGTPSSLPHSTEAVWTLADHRSIYVVEDAARAGTGAVTIMVDELEAHLATVAARGLTHDDEESHSNEMRKVIFRDPDGNEVGFGGAVGRVARSSDADAENAELERVRAELLAREPIFHRPEFGTRAPDYLNMTSEDYWEVGASGRVYERDAVVAELVARGKVPGDESWVVSDSRVRRVAVDTFAFTYRLDQAGRFTRRLTLWRQRPSGWEILYHQGTVIADR